MWKYSSSIIAGSHRIIEAYSLDRADADIDLRVRTTYVEWLEASVGTACVVLPLAMALPG